jgi:diaminohydroxyphosphoribosylaminopyrimidine deaminase / 5-amino-6-(5-phosphoribosylamino)uracil reductase
MITVTPAFVPAESADGDICNHSAVESWPVVPQAFRAGALLPSPWEELFGPLRTGAVDDLVVVGQVGQSLDGRIATTSGHSHYINGTQGLAHLHRLRAIVDAVVVGIGTVLADDPQLTVRRVAGPHPARVVVDPRGRLPVTARMLMADGVDRLVVAHEGTRPQTMAPSRPLPFSPPSRPADFAAS